MSIKILIFKSDEKEYISMNDIINHFKYIKKLKSRYHLFKLKHLYKMVWKY